MSEHDDVIPLERMTEGVRSALEVVRRADQDGSSWAALARWALIQAVQSVGFAAGHVSPAVQARHRGIPWVALAQQSDSLLSEYDRVDAEALRRRVVTEFPDLLQRLEAARKTEAAQPRAVPASPVTEDEVAQRLGLSRDVLERFCQEHGIRRLSVFGSIVREDFQPGSDVDVLVEFEPGRTPGLGFLSIQDRLSDLVGRRVDLLTPGSMGAALRERVQDQARDVYVAGG